MFSLCFAPTTIRRNYLCNRFVTLCSAHFVREYDCWFLFWRSQKTVQDQHQYKHVKSFYFFCAESRRLRGRYRKRQTHTLFEGDTFYLYSECQLVLQHALSKILCPGSLLCQEALVFWQVTPTCSERDVTHCRASFRSLNLFQNMCVGVTVFVFIASKLVNKSSR